MTLRWIACIPLILVALSGCIGAGDADDPLALDGVDESSPAPEALPDNETTTPPTPTVAVPPPAPKEVTVSWDDGLTLRAPLDVVLLGFNEATAAFLQDRFVEPYGPKQSTLQSHPEWDTNDGEVLAGRSALSAAPLRQSVDVRVHAGADADRDDYLRAVATSDASPWNGNAAEAWLADYLEREGLAGGPLAPLVLLHAGTEGHAYTIQYSNGYWTPARVAGGIEDVLLMDLSAASDDYTGTDEAYMEPVAVGDVDALESAVRDAVRFRLLQGPLYPVPVAPCHAVTLLYAVHTTGDQGLFAGTRADDALDAGLVERALEELTSEEVHVDVVRYDLPQDDPALWAFVRLITAGQSYQGQELARNWIDENWETIHVDHAGCEEYVSLLVYSDYLENTVYGIAEYDGDDRRFSFSIVPEWVAGIYEPGLLGGGCCKSESIEGFQLVNMLFAHETGHLFGQMHPHHAIDDEEVGLRWTFSPTRTVMSYAIDERDVGFGELDQRNWERNRLGYVAQALDDAGLHDDAVAAGFLDRIRDGDFAGAVDLGQGLLVG